MHEHEPGLHCHLDRVTGNPDELAGERLHQASYSPATIITAKALGNGAANIATWRAQNTLGAGTFYVVRHAIFMCPTTARAVTVEQGSTAADTTAQKIWDAVVVNPNSPGEIKGWITVQNNDYFEGFANNTDVNGGAYGVQYS